MFTGNLFKVDNNTIALQHYTHSINIYTVNIIYATLMNILFGFHVTVKLKFLVITLHQLEFDSWLRWLYRNLEMVHFVESVHFLKDYCKEEL